MSDFSHNDQNGVPVRYRTFGCPVCSMLISVTREQMGTRMICPDCEREIIVPTYLDFDHPTEDEIRRERLDRQERDQLYSPMRNPNRVGLDLDADSIYALGGENSTGQAKQEKLIPIHCRICETLMYARPDQVGQTIECPDCGTKTVVTQALKEQLDTVEATFNPGDVGSYDLGAVPAAPAQTFQLPNGRMVETNPNSSLKGQIAPSLPESTLTRVFKKTKQAREAQASQDSASQGGDAQNAPEVLEPPQTSAKPQYNFIKPGRSTSSFSGTGSTLPTGSHWGQAFLSRGNATLQRNVKTPPDIGQNQTAPTPPHMSNTNAPEPSNEQKKTSHGASTQAPRAQGTATNQQVKTPSSDDSSPEEESSVLAWFNEGANERLKEFYEANDGSLPQLVLRRRGDNYVWAYPSPPKVAPMLNGTFKIAFDPNVIGWGLFLIMFGGIGANILVTMVIANIKYARDRGLSGAVHGMEQGIGMSTLFSLVLAYLMFMGSYFNGIYNSACLGANKVLTNSPDDKNSRFMDLLRGFWTLGIAITSMAPGLVILAILGVSKGASFFELWSEEADSFSSLIPISLIGSLSFWFFFPIFWLSTRQSSSFFAPISFNIWHSFATQTKHWCVFYIMIAILGWTPSFIWGLFLAEDVFWYAMPILLIYFTVLLGTTLGRLGWILDDSIRELDYDD